MKNSATASLSIIVAAGRSIERLDKLLSELAPQLVGTTTDVIVSSCCDDASIAGLKTKYPSIVFLSAGARASLPLLLGRGIAQAKGQILAITDSSCHVDHNWLSAICDAHKAISSPVIGGAVELFRASSLGDWAIYFCDYGQFMLPVTTGVSIEVPGNNFSFKRSAVGDLRAFERTGFWKTYWCQKLQREGFQLTLTPTIVVSSEKSMTLSAHLFHRFQYGRCFAGMRLSEISFPWRIIYTFGSLVLPFLLFARIAKRVVPKKRHLKEFLLSSPLVFLAVVVWSVGELCGYLLGQANSCESVLVIDD